jgi:hypothetical protein
VIAGNGSVLPGEGARRQIDQQQPTPDARIAPARERDYGDLIALLEGASLPTEDLERSSMANFLVARDGSGKVVGAIGVECYRPARCFGLWLSRRTIEIAGWLRGWWWSLKPGAALWWWWTCSC